MTFPRIALFALLFSLLASSAAEIRLPAGFEKVTSAEGITEYRLNNGLRVLLFPDGSKPIITVNITYLVGSRHENYGETGMAHLLEHLLFKGTPKHPNIPKELTERGARPNGTTYFDRTNYYETFDATEDNLRWALGLEADRMINSYVSRKDLESEFTVVRNEFERGENNPVSVLYKRMLAAVFQWHNYGHSTIGEKSDIEGAPIERLQAFYKHYYQPDNAVLLIAGKIDEEKTLELVREAFGSIPKPERKLITTYTQEPTQDGEREITLRRVGDVQVFAAMFRTVAGSHPDYPALMVLEQALTDAPSGRLYKALVETRKAASVSGFTQGLAEGGMMGYFANVRLEQSLPEAREAMLAVLADLKENPLTPEEVNKAKVQILKQFELMLKRTEQLGLELSEYIGTGDWRLAFLTRDLVEQTTPEAVAQAARKYLKPANRTVGSFIPDSNPDRTEVPPAPDLAVLLKDYKGKAAVAKGEDFDPSPENIESRTTRGQLENGLKFALLPKRTRGESVQARITLRFGNLDVLKGKADAAEFAASMLNRGTKRLTREQIKNEFDRLKAQVFFSGGAASAGASIETDRANLAETMRLAAEILREASFPEDEFEKLRIEQLASLEQQKSEPTALANNMYARISRPKYAPDDPRYISTFDEEAERIRALTLDQVRAFHRQFYGASDATVSVVGDFDASEIKAVLRETLGNWSSQLPYQRIATSFEPVPIARETINTPDKANAVYIMGYRFPMRDDHPEHPAIVTGGYILGGGFLNSRLATRIRQQEGLSYSVGGGFSASSHDTNAAFNASMIYNPANLAKLESAFREEIERVQKDGFTAEELEAAKSGLLKSRRVSRSSDSGLASMLSNYLDLNRDFGWDREWERRLEALTLDQVNAAMRKHLDYAKLIGVKAGDFSKASVQ
jgi:zinc protease